jgi:hypothetical protein
VADPIPTRPPEDAPLALKVSIVLLAVLVVLVGAILVVLALPSPEPAGVAGTSTATPSSTEPAASQPGTDNTAFPSVTPAASELATNATPSPTRRPWRTQEPPEPTPPPSTATATPSLPVDATIDEALARCPTADEIALVDNRIRLTFVDDPTVPKLVCHASDGSVDLTRLEEFAYQAVLSMRRIKFDAPLPWTDKNMFRWFTDAVTGIQFAKTQYSHCCESPMDIVITTDITIPDDIYWDEDGWGVRGFIGLLAHEARHAEGYPHTCAYSEAAGGYADDQTMEEMGAWAVNSLYFQWVADHSDVAYMTPVDAPPASYRDMARESAESLAHYRICSNYENGP